ncbi:MAG: cobalt-precorrin 5A hydrolase [Spirochaetia bacterium]|nr:cobalt-precorrin 5A hydrolase [Spirochaetia bacterium]
MKTSIFCFSDYGSLISEKLCSLLGLEKNCIHRRVDEEMGVLFEENDALIFIGACGIAVRAIAPYIKSKTTDPAVVVIDDRGKYVIPILSGHIGGANRLAQQIAQLLGAAAVITTATDCAGKFSCDAWAVQNDCAISSMEAAKKVSSAILKRDIPVISDSELPSCLPQGLVPGEKGEIGIYIGIHEKVPFKTTLQLIPRVLVLGIGCRKGTLKEHLLSAVRKVLADNNLDIRAVGRIASIDVKMGEAGLLSLAKELGAEISFYTAAELNSAEGDFEESAFVKNTVGTDNVCERSAALAGGKLIVKKTVLDSVTIAVSEKEWEMKF